MDVLVLVGVGDWEGSGVSGTVVGSKISFGEQLIRSRKTSRTWTLFTFGCPL
jgi:hypothetical protein